MAATPFIGYSNNDWDAVVELRERLSGVGLHWTELRPPGRRMAGLRQMLTECSAFIALAGRDAVWNCVGAECEAALNLNLRQRSDEKPRLRSWCFAVAASLPPLKTTED